LLFHSGVGSKITGVDFTNQIPKEQKDSLIVLLGSALEKAARKMLAKLTQDRKVNMNGLSIFIMKKYTAGFCNFSSNKNHQKHFFP